MSHISLLCVYINIQNERNKKNLKSILNNFVYTKFEENAIKVGSKNYSIKYKIIINAIIFLFYLPFSAFSESIKTESVEEIIAKIKSNYNIQSISKFRDITFIGSMSERNGAAAKFSFYKIFPDMSRLKILKGRLESSAVITPSQKWVKITGMAAMPLDSYQKERIEILNNAISPKILDYKNHFKSLEFIAKSKVNGEACYQLRAYDNTENSIDYYFSVSELKLVKLAKTAEIDYEKALVEAYFDDYPKSNKNSIPHKIECYIGNQENVFKLEEIIYDSGISESDFVKPN